jgi:hypothetical protein
MKNCRFRFDDVLMYVLLGEGGHGFCRYFPLQSDASVLLGRVQEAVFGYPADERPRTAGVSQRPGLPPVLESEALVPPNHLARGVQARIDELRSYIASEAKRPYRPLSEKDAAAYAYLIRRLRYEPPLKQY